MSLYLELLTPIAPSFAIRTLDNSGDVVRNSKHMIALISHLIFPLSFFMAVFYRIQNNTSVDVVRKYVLHY